MKRKTSSKNKKAKLSKTNDFEKPKVIKSVAFNDELFKEFCKHHCSLSSFNDSKWFINPSDCLVIEEKQRKSYLSRSRKSCKFKTRTNESALLEEWIQLDLFQTYHNTESDTFTAFIGSHAYCLEWLPFPCFTYDYGNNNFEADYLLVGSFGEEGGFDDYEDKNFVEKDALNRLRKQKGLLQVWKLEDKSFNIACCFALNYGTIWAIEACKGGTSYSQSGQRLSLIAISFDDGFIRIFAIPFLSALNSCRYSPPIYSLRPLAVLLPPFSSYTVCKCISWSWTDSQRYLVAGYGNGAINYFDLETKSSLFSNVEKETNIFQIKSIHNWLGHGALVTAVQILPIQGSNIIISGSWDRKIKVWNILEYSIVPLLILHRSVVDCIYCSPLWLSGAFIAFESSFLASNQATISYRALIEESTSSESRTFCSISCYSANVYSMSMSNFFNSFLFSDSAGNVILQNGFKPRYKKKSEKKHADVVVSTFNYYFKVFSTQ